MSNRFDAIPRPREEEAHATSTLLLLEHDIRALQQSVERAEKLIAFSLKPPSLLVKLAILGEEIENKRHGVVTRSADIGTKLKNTTSDSALMHRLYEVHVQAVAIRPRMMAILRKIKKEISPRS